jgi:hypothetical protein
VRHVDPEQLSLLALGGPADQESGEHLRTCVDCAGELDALRTVTDLTREAVAERELPDPPEHLWRRIAAEAGVPETPSGPVRPMGLPAHRREPDTGTGGADGRRRGWLRPATALLAAAVAGVAGTLVAVRPWQTVQPAALSPAAVLAPVDGRPAGASGSAVVVEGGAGPQLRVTAAGLPLQDGYYEVWVYDGRRNMVSLGVLGRDSAATLPLPPTLDLREYPVVDVSQERYDGDQTHSTTSVLRGTLTDR